jgi:hypothetical protein
MTEISSRPERIQCPQCRADALYQGTQEGSDCYTCPNGHLTRKPGFGRMLPLDATKLSLLH